MTEAADWRGAVGDVWADEWRRTDRAFAALSPSLDAAILAAAPGGPFRALDVGCGAGGTSLSLATARPDAAILGVDLSPALVGVARDRAAGRAHVAFASGDAIHVAETAGPVDLLFSRHGVMFFPDPSFAFTALHGVTRPGGALVFSCFADPAANTFAVPLARALDLPAPTSAGPGPFAFADPDRVAALLTAAGWRDPRPQRVDFPYRVGAGDAPLDDAVSFLSRIGPAATAMRGSHPDRRRELRDSLREFLSGYADDKAVDLPAAAWLWSATA